MDAYSSGEEQLVKIRKPYTITKQRERWTDEEHNKFLEALKLHGRAWQRIEEHIGTKTAVQIRSHAQKFFSKLEKEALVKGVPIGEAIDMEIPPPRPKRKPSNPYPRKTVAVSSPKSQVKDGKHIPSRSPPSEKQVVEPPSDKNGDDDEEQNPKGSCGGDRCSDVFTLDKSPSLETTSREIPAKGSSNLEFMKMKKSSINDEISESHVDNGPNKSHHPDKPASVEMIQSDSNNKTQATKSFPRHAPVQILDGSQGLSSDVSYQEPRAQMEITGHPSISSNHHIHSSCHPSFNPLPNNEEVYASFQHMSSTFSSLIVSALLQNPAAHAAACFSASLWPSPHTGNSANSPSGNHGGFPVPSMEAIVAATVAAATAWWAAHGLSPLSSTFHSGFPCQPAAFGNVGEASIANEDKQEKEENKFQIFSPQVFEVLRPKNLASNSENCGDKMDIEVEAINAKEGPSTSEQKDVTEGKNKKQVDRSSCGSNTPSGSDIETDALGMNDNGNKEAKDPDVNNDASDLYCRRIKILGNLTDNWKEVSDEGRLAFKALFSKGRLPQSFSPPHNVASIVQNTKRSNNEALQFDLNSKACEFIGSDQCIEKTGGVDQGNVNTKDEVLRIGLCQGNLTSNRTGFKPYKRCSVEARENRSMDSSSPEQGNCAKRLRIEGEASI